MGTDRRVQASLERVRIADQRLTAAKHTMNQAVADARSQGASWQKIADTIGLTLNAVWEHFVRRQGIDRTTAGRARKKAA